MTPINFEDSAGMTVMELGIFLMLERSDSTSLLEMSREFGTHWRTEVTPGDLIPSYRRMIERNWFEPHPTDSARVLVTDLGKAVSYAAFLGFVRLVDPSNKYFMASVVYGLTTRPRGMADDD